MTATTVTIDRPGLTHAAIPVTAESTVGLVQHDTGTNLWYALLVDGQHYDLVMWKHTIGRPQHMEALNQALADVQAAIAAMQAPAALTPTTAPAVTKRVGEFDMLTKDYAAYISIDGEPEEYIGSRRTQGAADRLCDEYAFHYYSDNHTPEKAAEIAAAAFDPEPDDACPNCKPGRPCYDHEPTWAQRWIVEPAAPAGSNPGCTRPATRTDPLGAPVCDACDAAGLERLRRGVEEERAAEPVTCRCGAPATRHVTAGWDDAKHPDLAIIAAQVLLPLAHLNPDVSANYVLIRTNDKIAAPLNDHAIVIGLIDALNEVARQLPARPDSITAAMHIGDELYQVSHNGPPRVAPPVTPDDLYLRALDGLGPWPEAA